MNKKGKPSQNNFPVHVIRRES